MLKKNKRHLLWFGLLLLLIVPAVLAQNARTLEPGTPMTGTLNASNLAQVYTLQGSVGEVVTLTTVNPNGVPLAVVLTDASGAIIAQSYDLDITGQVTLSDVSLPTTGDYTVTVFKSAGVDSFTDATFTLTLTVVSAAPAVATATVPSVVQPTAQPSVQPTTESTSGSATPTTPVTLIETGTVVTTSGLQVQLSWNTTDDLDLEVRDPVGGSLYWETPTIDSGGTISANANQGCANTVNNPTETATWSPGGIPTGSYEVLVYYQQACTGESPVTFTISTTVDGTPLDPVQGTLLPGQVYDTSFLLYRDGTSGLSGLGGVVTEDLPDSAAAIIAAAQPVSIGSSVAGTITNKAPYEAYSFEGQTNDLVTVDMSATSGNLDTFLFLIDSSGNVVRSNDDRVDGVTDAEIVDALLPAPGTYYVVATRYAKRIGGTQGNYTLTLTSQAVSLPEEFVNLPRGALEMRLLWNTNADLQLLVRDPAGNAVYDDVPQIRSGGRLAASGNVNCTQSTGTPFSYIYWPTDTPPRAGVYEVEVWFQSDCGDTSPVNFNLYVTYNGKEVLTDSARPLLNERYLTSFTITANGDAIPSDGGIITGVDLLDWQAEQEGAIVLNAGEPRNGSITQDNKFDVYTFSAQAGDVVNIAMNNTSGTLDPTLYLLTASGVLVDQNDDAVAGENTNSLISNLTLPADGQYIIIATHFGARYGGTTGTYSLTLTQQN